jgi:5-oxoprolinase (ATP-hydrolysing) subunit A
MELNCDLGEGEHPARTRALMRHVDAVNIACGGHAGDAGAMERCAKYASLMRLRAGAHPGLNDSTGFGRRETRLSSGQLELLLLHQAGALAAVLKKRNLSMHHIKLHGALYHMTEVDQTLGRAYLKAVGKWWPEALIYARAGSPIIAMARRMGLRAREEVFVDRAYLDDGRLVPRNQPGALISSLQTVIERVESLRQSGTLTTVTGSRIKVNPETLCLHSDSPGAVRMASVVSRFLKGRPR